MAVEYTRCKRLGLFSFLHILMLCDFLKMSTAILWILAHSEPCYLGRLKREFPCHFLGDYLTLKRGRRNIAHQDDPKRSSVQKLTGTIQSYKSAALSTWAATRAIIESSCTYIHKRKQKWTRAQTSGGDQTQQACPHFEPNKNVKT